MKLGIPLVKGQSSETKAMAEQEQRRPSGEREKEGAPKTKNEETNLGPQSGPYQFDFLNWFYWSIWWQQYWASLQASQLYGYPGGGFPSTSPWAVPSPPLSTEQHQGQGSSPHGAANGQDHMNNYHQQWMQFYNQMNINQQPQMNMPPFHPQFAGGGNVTQRPGRMIGQQQPTRADIMLRIRLITGYEVFIAPVWKRILAELIDVFLFGIILKLYLPDVDYRVPEVIFEGADVWGNLEDEEAVDVRDTLALFLYSVFLQRLLHSLMEIIWLIVFSCTPGKWLMGLRVFRCSAVFYTRTAPGQSIRIQPGGKLSFLLIFFRSLFKATVSLFCPLIIFFFTLNKGRTKYDELFQCAVVDTRTLHRPVFANQNQARPHVQVG